MSGSVDSVTTIDCVGRYLMVRLSPGLDLGDLHLLSGAVVISRPKLFLGHVWVFVFVPGSYYHQRPCGCPESRMPAGAIMTTGPKLLLLAMSGFVILMPLWSLLMFVAQVTTGYEGCAELSRGEPAPPLEGTCLPFSHHHT